VNGAMVLAYCSEGCMLCSAGCLSAGWYQIRRRRIPQHRRLMLTASWLGLGFFVFYVAHSAVYGDTNFGGPAAWSAPYLAFLQVHVLLATAAGVLGVVTLRRALLGRFALHRRIAPWTATMWLVAAGTGLAVFLLLYVIFAPGPATNVLRTLIGPGPAH
jgi:putative membrane protein